MNDITYFNIIVISCCKTSCFTVKSAISTIVKCHSLDVKQLVLL